MRQTYWHRHTGGEATTSRFWSIKVNWRMVMLSLFLSSNDHKLQSQILRLNTTYRKLFHHNTNLSQTGICAKNRKVGGGSKSYWLLLVLLSGGRWAELVRLRKFVCFTVAISLPLFSEVDLHPSTDKRLIPKFLPKFAKWQNMTLFSRQGFVKVAWFLLSKHWIKWRGTFLDHSSLFLIDPIKP